MSWTTISSKKVKIRKTHHCYGCNTYFPPGTIMNYNFSTDGGDTSSTNMCGVCENFLADKWRDMDDEGLPEGGCLEYPQYKEFKERINSPLIKHKMTEKLRKSPNWAGLKAFANTLTDEQLSQPIRWWGEEKGGTATFSQLEEDYVTDDEGYSPKSSYDPETVQEMIDEYGVMPGGTPMIYVD